MKENSPLVCVIDDESSVRDSLTNLLRSAGLKVQSFASARDFLNDWPRETPGCLVLDVQMPGLSGLDLQRQMVAADWRIPIIFITSHADDGARARALEAGAVDFLYKPFREEELVNAIDAALKHS